MFKQVTEPRQIVRPPTATQAVDLLVLAPFDVRSREARPRRFMDKSPLPAQIAAASAVAAWFDNDEVLETQFFEKSRSRLQRIKSLLKFLYRHRWQILGAKFVYCVDNTCFALLLFLAKLRLFDPRGKIIRRVAFHDGMLDKLEKWLNKSDPAFQVEFITHDQVARAAKRIGPQRVCHRSWKIDCHWYQAAPAGMGSGEWLLCPGNIQRDEKLIMALLATGQVKIIRAGRSEELRKVYADWLGHPNFRLEINSDHESYRRMLLSAAAVLLPIQTCDEPAGLTAALETVACQIPLLANESMGISELFGEVNYPLALVKATDAAGWLHAIQSARAWHSDGIAAGQLKAARDLLTRNHAILPNGEDWLEIVTRQPKADPAP